MFYYTKKLNKIYYEISDTFFDLETIDEVKKAVEILKKDPKYNGSENITAYYYYIVDNKMLRQFYNVAKWNADGKLIAKRENIKAEDNFIVEVESFGDWINLTKGD